MKFTHIVVKEGNGKPSKDQIDNAAMVKNAGQTFAIIATFDDEPKQAILIDAKQAKDIEEHQKSHHFEIHKLEEPESGEPIKPGEPINESLVNILQAFTQSDSHQARALAELVSDELGIETV